MIEKKKEELLELFKYVDPNFFDWYAILIENILKVETPEFDANELLQEVNRNDGIDYNTILNEAIESLGIINPEYKSIAYNVIKDPENIEFKIPKKQEDALDNAYNEIYLSNNYYTVIVLVHEIMHNIVAPQNTESVDEHSGIIDYMLDEVPSMTIEQLTVDRVSEKAGIPFDAINKLHILNFQQMARGYASRTVRSIQAFLKDPSKENKDLDYAIEHHQYENIPEAVYDFAFYFTHYLGMIVSSYVYAKIKEDPSNAKMIDKLLSMIARGKYYPKEAVQTLEELGIPIVQDGKLSLNQESIQILYNSYFARYGKYYLPNQNISMS